ncbi:hypothetical protein KTO58_26600 [Chitinophaga pendula]|uniref:hypothetical protein n=1 Tax=Chitinophaga TaxID=79328 RepID=UPI000BAE7EE6|nr:MULTISPECIES: hypothetical protein [Chitinophaga]ASZ09866.1 hypothetical protein CK934_02165 [Chitinophaga sp. MD30]UCJ07192.1 hypothetical protein KTO58_26600 [Chitinophaga pendula]
MDETKALVIESIGSDVLTVKLSEILNCITDGDQYVWSLLWITAIGSPDDLLVLEFEEKINKSANGCIHDWKELFELSFRFHQIIEILIIGALDSSKLHRYTSDEEMYESCHFVLELVDSSYWEVHTKSDIAFRKMKAELPVLVQ